MNVFCEVGMGQYSKRGAVGDAKLPVNPVQVDLDSSFGESKPLRYFLVGQTFRHHAEDLAFTRGEWVNSIRSYLPFANFFKGCCTACPSQPTALVVRCSGVASD